jgi:hypothetical protein
MWSRSGVSPYLVALEAVVRKDMAKVIVERSRVAARDRKGRSSDKYGAPPNKQSMRRPYLDRKSLNENLAPLRRFLESSVGKKWDNVYSEICSGLKLTSAVQKHVRDHVFDFVTLNVQVKDGKIFALRRYGSGFSELSDKAMYVDPKTGILRVYKKKNIVRAKERRPVLEEELNYLLRNLKMRVTVNSSGVIAKRVENYDGLASSVPIKAAVACVDAKAIFPSISDNESKLFAEKYLGSKNTYLRGLAKELFRLYQTRRYEIVDLKMR